MAKLISEPILEENFTEIVKCIRKLHRNEVENYRNEDNDETFLHELLSRPQTGANEQILIQLFQEFIDNGCDINAIDSYSWTCLHYCCVHNYHDLASFIIQHPKFIPGKE